MWVTNQIPAKARIPIEKNCQKSIPANKIPWAAPSPAAALAQVLYIPTKANDGVSSIKKEMRYELELASSEVINSDSKLVSNDMLIRLIGYT